MKQGGSAWLLPPAALSLLLFVWLLMLYPAASGRVYAAGVYVLTALLWLVDAGHRDWLGGLVMLSGMLIIVAGWERN